MLCHFVSKVRIMIFLLGCNLMSSDRQLHFMVEKCILRFCPMSYLAIRMSNLHIIADFSEFNFFCFHTPIYFKGKKFHTPTKINHFVSTPIEISSAPTRSYLNDRSLKDLCEPCHNTPEQLLRHLQMEEFYH